MPYMIWFFSLLSIWQLPQIKPRNRRFHYTRMTLTFVFDVYHIKSKTQGYPYISSLLTAVLYFL
jgi:hypothetical protein